MITIRLYKYGIDITNATLQTLAYELGVEKSVSEMSQMEKQQLRIIAILRGSKVAWGDQANTINSLANQMRLFENNTEELSMVFGQLFVPLLTKALPIVNGLTIALKNLMTNIKGMLNIKIDVSTMGQGTAADDMGEIAEETENAENALKEYKNQLFGFDEVNKLSDTEANATLNTDMGDTIDLEQEILTATSEYEKFWEDAYNAMEDKVGQWAKYFEQFMVPIQEVFEHFKFGFNMDFKDFGKDIMGLTTKLNDWITRAIEKTPWGELGWKLGQFITGSTVESFNLLGKSGTTISKLIIGINDFITRSTEGIEWDSIFLAIVNGITDFANNLQIGDIIDSFANTIVALNNAILEIVGAIIENPEEIADMVFSLIAKTVELGIALMNANSKIFTNLIAGVVDKIIKAAVNELGEGFGIISEISDFLEDVFSNGIDNAANNLMNSRHMQVLQPIVDELSRPFNDLVDVGEKLETSTNEIVTTIEGIWMNLVDWFDNIGTPEWQDVIEGNFNEERWHRMIEPITNAFQERWNTLVTWFEGSAIPGWWETVRTNFTMERWRDTVGSITEAFTRRWNGMRRWFNAAVSEWWLEVQRFFSAENWENHLDGIEEGFVNAFNNAIAQVRQIWNGFANWINNALSFEFEGFNRSFEMFGTTYEVGIPSFNIDLGRLPTYSTGGFPEDGLFFANRDEIIGKFPGGKSTVVNDYQIQDGIEEAAYRGMARALTQHQGNGGNVTVTLQGDANELFKVVQNKANNYAMQTGQSPFLI